MDRLYSPAISRLLLDGRDALLIDVSLGHRIGIVQPDGSVVTEVWPVTLQLVQLGQELLGVRNREEIFRLGPVDDGFDLAPFPDPLARSKDMAVSFVTDEMRHFGVKPEAVEIHGGRPDVVKALRDALASRQDAGPGMDPADIEARWQDAQFVIPAQAMPEED